MASSPTPLPGLASRPDHDEIVARFDAAWADGHAPRLEEFLDGSRSTTSRRKLLHQLVRADLIRRWERPGTPPLLEWYCGRYPELGAPEQLPTDLITEEYAARLRRGERPSVLDYLDRFPDREDLVPALDAVDPDRTVDARARLDTLSSRSGDTQSMPPAPAAGLIETIQRLGILLPKQADSLRHGPKAPRELCEWMIRQQWLTPYQGERLLDDGTGLVIGPYLILEPIGQGRTGKVYRALHRTMRRVAALKVLQPEEDHITDEPDPEAYKRFLKEIEAVGRLDNAHIIHTYDAGQHDGSFYLAMEYAGGTDLKRLVEKHGPMRVLNAVEYARQAAIGLQHAADAGLVHRDVKPANLLLTRPTVEWPMGCIKLLDLGIARVHKSDHSSEQSQLTQEGALIGTADFMSPEQAINASGVDVRSDLYSLGCTLFFLLTGRVPYPGGTPVQKSIRHTRDPIPELWRFREDVPMSICKLIEKLMAKNPADRFHSATEAAKAMGNAVAELSMPAEDLFASIVQEAAATPPAPKSARESTAENPILPAATGIGWWWWVIGLGFAVILGGGIFLARLLFPGSPARSEIDEPTRPASADPPSVRGSGLLARYYPSDNFTGNPELRTDPVIDLSWNQFRRPFPKTDKFSVVWVGEIETIESGEYQFQTITDDGARLYIYGRKVIDDWKGKKANYSGKIRLPARNRVPVRLEYFNHGPDATAKLLWTRPTRTEADLIPRSQLYPVAPIADSRIDFSDKDGENGWSYFSRRFENGMVIDSPMVWENGRWKVPGPNHATITAETMHPGDGIWVFRRWSPKTAGIYRISITLAKLDPAGDGTAGVVTLNGEDRWRYKLAPDNLTGTNHSLEMQLKPTDIVEFGLDPLQTSQNDTTLYNILITAK